MQTYVIIQSENGHKKTIEAGTITEALATDDALRAEVARLKKETKILEIKNSSSLANNLCSDHRDKQAGKSCLACEIETLRERLRVVVECSEMYKDADALLNDKEVAKETFQLGTLYHLWQAIKQAAKED